MLLEFPNAIIEQVRPKEGDNSVVYVTLLPADEDGKKFKCTVENADYAGWELAAKMRLPFTIVFTGQFSVYSNGSGKDRNDSLSFKASSAVIHDPFGMAKIYQQMQAQGGKKSVVPNKPE